MSDDRYYIKIVPQRGDAIHRFVVRRYHLAIAIATAALCLLVVASFAFVQAARVREEHAALARIAKQTELLHRQLQRVQREDQEIGRLIGAPPLAKPRSTRRKMSWARGTQSVSLLEAHVKTLASASATLLEESQRERNLVMRVLNLRHVREIAQERLIAFIPSIDPVDGSVIVGCFCYRTYPSVEFHRGLDLAANYGEPVHAAAAGTVIAAGWDGGYGLKIEIDHGNGYETWYAHLSRIGVSIGERVYKSETIAAVGATGFATGPHLHYQVMLNGRAIDPTPYLRGVPANVLAAVR